MLRVMVMFTCEWAVVSTFAGFGNGTYVDGSGTTAGFNYPSGVAVDASGNVFVADRENQRIRKVTAGGGTRIGSVALCARLLCSQCDIAASA